MTSLQESNTPNGKSVDEAWSKGAANVTLHFLERLDGTGTRLGLQVYVQLGQ